MRDLLDLRMAKLTKLKRIHALPTVQNPSRTDQIMTAPGRITNIACVSTQKVVSEVLSPTGTITLEPESAADLST